MGWFVLACVSVLVAAGGALVWKRPVLALYAFVVGLVLHNTVFLLLYAGGARGWQLTAAQAWKEALLAIALACVVRDAFARRALAFRPTYVDVAAAAFAVIVVAYALLPQQLLGGQAGPKAELYALRHYLVPVAAYFIGRSLPLGRADVPRLALVTLVATAASAVAGIVEEYTVSVAQWHSLGAGRYYTDQLGFPEQHGPGGLPENFVLNSADGLHRRLVSFFLSPLGSAYVFVVALSLAATGMVKDRRESLALITSALTFAGLLFAFTRSTFAVLPLALVLVAVAVRRWTPAVLGGAAIAAAIAFAAVFPDVAPGTHFLAADLAYQRQHARAKGDLPRGRPLETTVTLSDPSVKSHLTELREGARSVLEHPQGRGIGNSGQTAARFNVPARAGESFYLELGADVGVLGLLFWLVFTGLTLSGLFGVARGQGPPLARRLAAGVLAAGAAIAALALISDVWGTPWLSYVLWWLSGSALTTGQAEDG